MYHLFFGALPENSYTFCTVKFRYEETMLIALDYMENGTKYIAMSQVYGGDWSRYSYIALVMFNVIEYFMTEFINVWTINPITQRLTAQTVVVFMI